MKRYTFDEVKAAVAKDWGMEIQRGAKVDGPTSGKDGRWCTTHSRTGFVVSGNFPGFGHMHRRYVSLSKIVRVFDLKKTVDDLRRKARSE
jgi:hypothetical protein